MIGLVAVVVVAIFTVVFASAAVMQQMEDRRREREVKKLILRQAQMYRSMYTPSVALPWDDEDIFEQGRGIVHAQPEWRGHRGSGDKGRKTPSQPGRGKRAA